MKIKVLKVLDNDMKEIVGKIFDVVNYDDTCKMYAILYRNNIGYILESNAEIVSDVEGVGVGSPIVTNAQGGKYEKMGRELGELTDQKRKAYGSSTTTSADIMKILYPNGITCDQYVDVLLMVRVIDKLCRIANDKQAFGESPWKDIAGYSLIGAGDCKE